LNFKFLRTSLTALCLLVSGLVNVANAGIIVEYNFDGNSLDSSGNGEHLTLVNGATYGSGYVNGALLLDGLNDYARVNIGNYSLSNFTVEAWVNVNNFESNVHYVSLFQDSYIVLGDWGTGAVHTWADGLSPISISGVTSPTINDWHHLAFSFDGTTQRSFLNGVLQNSVLTTGTLTNSASFNQGLTIGARYTGSVQYVKGSIDNVRIHDIALSVNDLGYYKDTTAVPEPSTLAIFALGIIGLASRRFKNKS
jgi:hypothetical protein